MRFQDILCRAERALLVESYNIGLELYEYRPLIAQFVGY